jgi:hypothetical protein
MNDSDYSDLIGPSTTLGTGRTGGGSGESVYASFGNAGFEKCRFIR